MKIKHVDAKKICPLCNYLGSDNDRTCPYCGIGLISECPDCKAFIKTPFAEYCYICGTSFKKTVIEKKPLKLRR